MVSLPAGSKLWRCVPRSDSMRNHGFRALLCFFVGVLLPGGSLLHIVSCFCSVNQRNYTECSCLSGIVLRDSNHWMCLTSLIMLMPSRLDPRPEFAHNYRSRSALRLSGARGYPHSLISHPRMAH